jgi:hypothetical protein
MPHFLRPFLWRLSVYNQYCNDDSRRGHCATVAPIEFSMPHFLRPFLWRLSVTINTAMMIAVEGHCATVAPIEFSMPHFLRPFNGDSQFTINTAMMIAEEGHCATVAPIESSMPHFLRPFLWRLSVYNQYCNDDSSRGSLCDRRSDRIQYASLLKTFSLAIISLQSILQ